MDQLESFTHVSICIIDLAATSFPDLNRIPQSHIPDRASTPPIRNSKSLFILAILIPLSKN